MNKKQPLIESNYVVPILVVKPSKPVFISEKYAEWLQVTFNQQNLLNVPIDYILTIDKYTYSKDGVTFFYCKYLFLINGQTREIYQSFLLEEKEFMRIFCSFANLIFKKHDRDVFMFDGKKYDANTILEIVSNWILDKNKES